MKPTLILSAAMAGEAIATASATLPSISFSFILLPPLSGPADKDRSNPSLLGERRYSSGLRSDNHRDEFLAVRAIWLQLADLAALAQNDRAVGKFDDVFH